MNNALVMSLLPGLIVFILTGFTIFAYKYPAGYFSLYRNLAFVLIGAVVAADVWTYAIHRAFQALSQFIPLDRQDLASDIIRSYDTPWWLFVLILAVGCYLSLLSFLPSFFGGEKPSNKARK